MKTQNSKLRTQDGFTLIEVSIAITLLALMALILYGAFYLGHRAVEKAQARSEEGQRLRSAGDFLGSYIRSAYPYRFSPRDPAISFSGEGNSLSFVSTLSLGMGGRGMSKVSISWDGEGDSGGLLTLTETIPVTAEDQGGGGYRNSLVLINRVRAFRVDYLDPQGKEERWVEQWDGKEKRALPRAVRIHVLADRGDGVQWIFPIMMSVLAP